ncbi:Arv1-domain-containing protein [Hymenopellis radicata]|nr:Arv1-domain-containing protein [Hymenopellis radicata]
MPICTTCTRHVPYLYTVYESAYNLRLEQCPSCGAFADPYVEHDSLLLLIDLILLKRGVYRHLLYNRGSEPRRIGQQDDVSRKPPRWSLIVPIGGTLTALDAFIRWSHLSTSITIIRNQGQCDHRIKDPQQALAVSPWSTGTIANFSRTFIGCFAETLAFHVGVIAACYAVLKFLSVVKHSGDRNTDIRNEFRFALIPLALFYSSVTKLFLLFLLTIWKPSTSVIPVSSSTPAYMMLLDDDKLDKEWIVRNVLGGMSAGFGLRVVLDCHPVFTMMIIVLGWLVKTSFGEQWLAYSIP